MHISVLTGSGPVAHRYACGAFGCCFILQRGVRKQYRLTPVHTCRVAESVRIASDNIGRGLPHLWLRLLHLAELGDAVFGVAVELLSKVSVGQLRCAPCVSGTQFQPLLRRIEARRIAIDCRLLPIPLHTAARELSWLCALCDYHWLHSRRLGQLVISSRVLERYSLFASPTRRLCKEKRF